MTRFEVLKMIYGSRQLSERWKLALLKLEWHQHENCGILIPIAVTFCLFQNLISFATISVIKDQGQLPYVIWLLPFYLKKLINFDLQLSVTNDDEFSIKNVSTWILCRHNFLPLCLWCRSGFQQILEVLKDYPLV